jgi:hypothetical protein
VSDGGRNPVRPDLASDILASSETGSAHQSEPSNEPTIAAQYFEAQLALISKVSRAAD